LELCLIWLSDYPATLREFKTPQRSILQVENNSEKVKNMQTKTPIMSL
jgi:hypothetical protein